MRMQHLSQAHRYGLGNSAMAVAQHATQCRNRSEALIRRCILIDLCMYWDSSSCSHTSARVRACCSDLRKSPMIPMASRKLLECVWLCWACSSRNCCLDCSVSVCNFSNFCSTLFRHELISSTVMSYQLLNQPLLI